MVRIVNYQERTSEDGNVFFALILQGGIELVQGKSGSFYATARKTSISSTFDEETCKSLQGTEIPGQIVKVECEPYDYTVKETGEVIELSHKYHFVSNEPSEERSMSNSTIDDFVKNEAPKESFSMNGVE